MDITNDKESKRRIVMFILIIMVCIFAIFLAVYVFLNSEDGSIQNITSSNTNTLEVDEKELLKENFNNIFKNTLLSNIDISEIQKKDNTLNIIYTSYNKTEKNENIYDLNVQVPHINIDSEKVTKINNDIDKIFKNKAESIVNEKEVLENVIYNVKYVSYIYNDIISVVIQCTLKEENNPQRVIIKTFNYNYKTDSIMEIDDFVQLKQINKSIVENKIKEEIKSQINMEESLKQAGYNIFNRYYESEEYKYQNINNMFIDDKNNFYIIFAYGNTNNTSEFDIVIF